MLISKTLNKNLPLILAIVLYLLIYLLRFNQGSWEINLDLFKDQRQVLDQKIVSLLPSPQAELLSGILLGENKNLPSGLRLALRDTSTLHVVVASGQNLSMVAGFFLSLAGILKRKNAIILSTVAVVLYTTLTGFQIPILRAALMFGLAALAQIFGRQSDGIRVLILTGGFLLLIDPYLITNLSFQLSFMATLGVIWVSPIILERINLVPLISQDLAVSLGAQLMVTPIIAQNFHQFSLVGLISNLLILWTISFIMILGTIMVGLSFISTFLAQIVAMFTSSLLTYFIYIVEFFSSLPFAWEYVGEQIWIVWVGYYLVTGGVLVGLANHSNLKELGDKI
jgi:competence protein ComEC